MVEMISLFAEFKGFPKKFKEIFANYIKNEKNSVLTQKKLEIIPTNQSITTGFSMGTNTNDFVPNRSAANTNPDILSTPNHYQDNMQGLRQSVDNLNNDMPIS